MTRSWVLSFFILLASLSLSQSGLVLPTKSWASRPASKSSSSADSLNCMSGLPSSSCCASAPVPISVPAPTSSVVPHTIDSVATLVDAIDAVYRTTSNEDWTTRKALLSEILSKSTLPSAEIAKYAHFDTVVPYTRNLVASDGKNYALLILCWNPGRESKIHNHPCDGCFVKVLRGVIQETRYAMDVDADHIRVTGQVLATAGAVTYMDDFVGLHKIGNPTINEPAISMHLYTPPYNTCKLWSSEKEKLSKHCEGKSCYYSEYGRKTGSAAKETDCDCFI